MHFIHFDRTGNGITATLAPGERKSDASEQRNGAAEMRLELQTEELIDIRPEVEKLPHVMAGYSGTPLVGKLGIRPNEKVIAINPPVNYEQLLADLPAGTAITNRVIGQAKFIHLFVTRRADLAKRLIALRAKLDDAGILWVSWPKKAAKMATDITEDIIREVALPLGFVDMKVCAVDETWSGLKLMIRRAHRKAGA